MFRECVRNDEDEIVRLCDKDGRDSVWSYPGDAVPAEKVGLELDCDEIGDIQRPCCGGLMERLKMPGWGVSKYTLGKILFPEAAKLVKKELLVLELGSAVWSCGRIRGSKRGPPNTGGDFSGVRRR